MSVCLGLDIGSTSIKGAILDLSAGTVQSLVREPFPDPIAGLPTRHFEVDLVQVRRSVQQVLDRLLLEAPRASGAFFCGQMGGIALVNPQAEPLSHYFSWRDQRTIEPYSTGGSYLDEIQRRWSKSVLAELGGELKPGSATSLLFWLAENGQLPAGAIPATIGDAVVANLCGTTPSMHPTQAIGLINLNTGDWHRNALQQLGLEKLHWPEIASLSTPIGYYVAQGYHLPCFSVLGDQQCALKGAGLEIGDLSLNISTGSQVSQLTEKLELGPHQTRFYFESRYLNTITHLPAGRSLNALVDLLTELARAQGLSISDPWSYISQAAQLSEGSELQCHLSFFSGPMGDVGSISQITVDNLNIGNLFHAAFKDMTNNFVQCARRLNSEQRWNRIVLSGGLTQSVPLLREFLSKQFQNPICESLNNEETLTGLLRIAQSQFH